MRRMKKCKVNPPQFQRLNRSGYNLGNNTARGLTLVELMISIAIVSILLTTVGPNIQSILVSNRITADVNNLSSVMRFARHAAVNEQTATIICPTSDFSDCANNWALPKMVFVDANGNGNRDEAETLAASSDAIAGTNIVLGITGAFIFSPNGGVQDQTARTITFCHQDRDVKFASALLITAFGKISISTDSNGDSVREDASGNALTCGTT